ncbi:acetyltransferase (GNAT) family protein [Motilibacter rhizosphaerae]|uniref:Acetyltransferase (GNAT) family protein n=1 Tax=Motilibacter rhizosphaerae TaxID=598652 RepID=A0A4Q7NWG8_9ACTN|nr:GNAT family N-acetyltransferase [Motilibacter rhizosphaerae]RZS91557.1 acetyltransferase (GNAT) family protein [Motilibacter rhizosphaerae]
MTPHVRAYQPTDLPALYDICVRTADAGGDARGQYASDLLMGDLFAAPYATLEPEHAHVLDAGDGRVVGYVLGTADTARFVERYRAEWIPATAERCPPPADPPVTADDVMLGLHHRPERMLEPAVTAYPAHLHIDLLPGWQGQGWGRALMAAFLDGLRAAGVPSVHLGMLAVNTGARAFYARLGFHPVAEVEPLVYLGRSTAPLGR